KYLQGRGLVISGKSILEVGAGATNSTGYELSRRFPGNDILLLEPCVEFDAIADRKLQPLSAGSPENCCQQFPIRRLQDSGALEDRSIDLILSHSVLEHVAQPQAFFQELKRILRPEGLMLHIADYRDHFFKYPYHFLQFSRKTWNRCLNPGDLPGWRLGEHLQIIRGLDLHVEILDQQREAAAFAKIRPHISPDYDLNDPYLDVTRAVLAVTRPQG
ncbi:MAG: class I SAM-dependent methyltransferase, partial [Syntrophales bacterium]|nr:class I SAM-dependent methyltransferase [Syntrophales bacterium]